MNKHKPVPINHCDTGMGTRCKSSRDETETLTSRDQDETETLASPAKTRPL